MSRTIQRNRRGRVLRQFREDDREFIDRLKARELADPKPDMKDWLDKQPKTK